MILFTLNICHMHLVAIASPRYYMYIYTSFILSSFLLKIRLENKFISSQSYHTRKNVFDATLLFYNYVQHIFVQISSISFNSNNNHIADNKRE